MVAYADALAALPRTTPAVLGDSFEWLCRFALSNSARYGSEIKTIMRWEQWSGADRRDEGIDLIVETVDGQYWAVQSKCYEGTVGLPDLHNFLNLASYPQYSFTRKILMVANTVTAAVARTAADSHNQVEVLDGEWFETLGDLYPADHSDLRIAAGAVGYAAMASRLVPRTLRAHQVQGRDAAVAYLQDHERTQIISACGTGKTYMLHAIAEQMMQQARDKEVIDPITVVLVPSLALIQQSIPSWHLQSKGNLIIRAVCSDDTVTSDAVEDEVCVNPQDLSAAVLHSVEEIQAFVQAPARTLGDNTTAAAKVIFCTYQSSHLLEELHSRLPEHSFELLVCDEAHRLAQRSNGMGTMVLDQSRVRARQRIFATATPRVVSHALRSKMDDAGLDKVVYSMDDPEVFGAPCFKLSMREAINRGILSDYKIAVVAMTKRQHDDLMSKIQSNHLVQVDNGKVITPTMAAAAVAVEKVFSSQWAQEHRPVTSMISYHSRVKNAEVFAGVLGSLGIKASSVSGAMSSAKRKSILDSLVSGDTQVVSNARCLTEGVDLPALEAITYVDPKYSAVDNAQSVGRVARPAEGKEYGLIIIPVIINETDDPQDIIEQSNFEHAYRVLSALKDIDSELRDEINKLQFTVTSASPQAADRTYLDRRFIMDVQGVEEVGLMTMTALSDNLMLRLVESLSDTWEVRFHQTKQFVHDYERLPSQSSSDTEGKRLGNWCDTQRKTYRGTKGKRLKPDQITALESLPGWFWNQEVKSWADTFEELQAFVGKGNPRLPSRRSSDTEEKRLGVWCHNQRKAYRGMQGRARLETDQVTALESLPGWVWNQEVKSWADTFEELQAFIGKDNPRFPSSRSSDAREKRLGVWCDKQRKAYRGAKGRQLETDQVTALESLPGWFWNQEVKSWADTFEELQAFVGKDNPCFPSRYSSDAKEKRLGIWCARQRQAYRGAKGRQLETDQVTALESLPGWFWSKRT